MNVALSVKFCNLLCRKQKLLEVNQKYFGIQSDQPFQFSQKHNLNLKRIFIKIQNIIRGRQN